MNALRSFHGTARGSLHILRGAPCEDSSASFSSENGAYHIAVVSDGHGDSKCFRSSDGSKFATEIAIDSLREFAEYLIQNKYAPGNLKNSSDIRRLTDSIVARWYDRVNEDFISVPPEANDLALIGVTSVSDIDEEMISHIYGATFIAALWMENMIILLQQGDGRCVVFFSDGKIGQPIPWDDRCINTTTTSLCDADAAERFRSCIIDLQSTPVAACYIGCDGIEDAYRDSTTTMEGLHTFYKYLSIKLLSLDNEDFNAFLHGFLPDFSADGLYGKYGSGDDVSVSGIADSDALTSVAKNFERDIHIYKLTELLFWKKDELNGKIRKYELLEKRMCDAADKYKKSKEDRERIKRRLTNLRIRQSDLYASLEEENQGLASFLQSSRNVAAQIDKAMDESHLRKVPYSIESISSALGIFQDALSFSKRRKGSNGKRRKNYSQLYRDIQRCAIQCTKDENLYKSSCSEVEVSKQLYSEAKETFEQFAVIFHSIEHEIFQIESELHQIN